jgi:protein-S-isoprenylcysteine O-methyltransferase Ste14
MISLTWSFTIVMLRFWLVLEVFERPGPLPLFFAVSESISLMTTVYALYRGKADVSFVGMLTPALYLTPLLFDLSAPTGPEWAAGFYIFLAPFQWFLRLRLGVRCTVSAPVFLSIVDRWPYSVIRHPMGCTEVLLCLCVALRFPCQWNSVVFALVAISAAACVLIEERFLCHELMYREYCTRVRWRLLPGVW